MLSPGTLLSSRYRIESVLGQGGMGAVYLATVEALDGKKVAVKEMELSGFSRCELPQAIRQFQREASFLAHLQHPNLVPVTDFYNVGEKYYLVMSYIEGQTLQQALHSRGAPFSWPEVKAWALTLVEVLDFLHQQSPPILFRDLKPSNIMLSSSGRLHLIDFGIARTAANGSHTSTFLRGTGTSGFAPIEQYSSAQSTDQRSDIYSLGATLYYLLTARIPPDSVERFLGKQELTPASQLQPALPRGIDGALARAMALAPDQRYANVSAFGRELATLDKPGFGEEKSVSRSAPAAIEPYDEELMSQSSWGGAAMGVGAFAVACLLVLLLGIRDIATSWPESGAETRRPIDSGARAKVEARNAEAPAPTGQTSKAAVTRPLARADQRKTQSGAQRVASSPTPRPTPRPERRPQKRRPIVATAESYPKARKPQRLTRPHPETVPAPTLPALTMAPASREQPKENTRIDPTPVETPIPTQLYYPPTAPQETPSTEAAPAEPPLVIPSSAAPAEPGSAPKVVVNTAPMPKAAGSHQASLASSSPPAHLPRNQQGGGRDPAPSTQPSASPSQPPNPLPQSHGPQRAAAASPPPPPASDLSNPKAEGPAPGGRGR